MKYRVEIAGEVHEVEVEATPSGYVVRSGDGASSTLTLEQRSDGSEHAVTPWGDLELCRVRRGDELWADVAGRRLSANVRRSRAGSSTSSERGSAGAVYAPMPGKLLRLWVAEGDQVVAGQPLAVIEAMKMENELVAPLGGVVLRVVASAPSTVEKGALLLELSPT